MSLLYYNVIHYEFLVEPIIYHKLLNLSFFDKFLSKRLNQIQMSYYRLANFLWTSLILISGIMVIFESE